MWDDENHCRQIEKLMSLYDFKKEVIKDLKPCPFCGCPMDGSVYPPNLCLEMWRLRASAYRIVCPRCGAAGSDAYTIEWAVINWNTRKETAK